MELITKWATSQWRRHIDDPNDSNHPSRPDSPSKGSTSFDAISSAADNGLLDGYLHESPAGASVGITGFLDGPFLSNGVLNGGLTAPDDGTLRVSFNSAEADLSFPNLNSTELFNIPEGFEEFLGNTMTTWDYPMSRNHGRATEDLRAAATSLLGNSANGNNNGTSQDLSMAVPAFSTLIGPW